MATTQTYDGMFGLRGRYTRSSGPKRAPVPPLIISWWLFAMSVAAFLTHYLLGTHFPLIKQVLAVMSLVTCGFAWLLAQALFRNMEDPHARFRRSLSVGLVATLFVMTLGLSLTGSYSANIIRTYVGNIQSLVGSAILFLTLLEAFDKINQFNVNERQFRTIFAGAYIAILGTSFIVQIPEFVFMQAETQAALSLIALIGSGFAVRYRLSHPLSRQDATTSVSVHVGESDPILANRIETLLQAEAMFLDSDIRLSDLARRLREPSYKISRCITRDLDYRNFNHMVNLYRIEATKVCFDDPEKDRLPILSIAMDCGFASIGPFNRAFKTQTGQTPSAYRRQSKRS